MTIKVLLIVQEGRSKQKYLDALTGCGPQVFTTSSFTDLSEEICSHKYHGLFCLDLPTKMKAIKENKAYVYRLVEGGALADRCGASLGVDGRQVRLPGYR